MNKNTKILKPALLCFLAMTVLCGIVYTAVVTGVAQLFFPHQANGSVITVTLKNGTTREYGSELIAQKFTKPQYLIGRPDGVTNLSPTGEKEKELVQKRVEWLRSIDPDNRSEIPVDLVTGSGSGVDPNISPAAAEYQAARIAKARNMSADAVRAVIRKYTTGRFLGFLGEPAVNVLKVNLALDGLL
ncbi:MAG: potassium-transporting ATPase subunit KdpC [Oscillospiraceae bacterium]|jgi:K+-transporting ATPase ATPase C chain|nr:potassium-transporting ATPase subunit KdpC [Oscillospiraceae bacterium]MCI2036339.1 potassium-transporting ATPase subunit KdpC [Oscillospiraceae bacterium]